VPEQSNKQRVVVLTSCEALDYVEVKKQQFLEEDLE
jgi:hypothetical protein